jgi:hypothetical protein
MLFLCFDNRLQGCSPESIGKEQEMAGNFSPGASSCFWFSYFYVFDM